MSETVDLEDDLLDQLGSVFPGMDLDRIKRDAFGLLLWAGREAVAGREMVSIGCEGTVPRMPDIPLPTLAVAARLRVL